jgi:hypothetical protein
MDGPDERSSGLFTTYQNSMIQDGGGERQNENKLRYDLVPPYAQEQYVRVLTAGANKYADHNWERGMKWSKVIASMKRHIAAYEMGADRCPESLELHMAHVMCNAAFITEYYKIYPQGDDRPLRKPRIGLDIDGVLANFNKAYRERFNLPGETTNWYFAYDVGKNIENIGKEFWLNIEPLVDGSKLPIEPVVYVTQRPIDSEVTKEWLFKNGFPCAPVVTVWGGPKIEALKEAKVDIFVDDRYDTFVELNNAGICTYLYDRPYNERYKIGHKRLKDLKDLL